jgi:hypothetical protein
VSIARLVDKEDDEESPTSNNPMPNS